MKRFLADAGPRHGVGPAGRLRRLQRLPPLARFRFRLGSAARPSTAAELTATEVIAEAEGMTLEERPKAIEESNGAVLRRERSTARQTALPLFIEYLRSIDPAITWSTTGSSPRTNKIFDQLTADPAQSTVCKNPKNPYSVRKKNIHSILYAGGGEDEDPLPL